MPGLGDLISERRQMLLEKQMLELYVNDHVLSEMKLFRKILDIKNADGSPASIPMNASEALVELLQALDANEKDIKTHKETGLIVP